MFDFAKHFLLFHNKFNNLFYCLLRSYEDTYRLKSQAVIMNLIFTGRNIEFKLNMVNELFKPL